MAENLYIMGNYTLPSTANPTPISSGTAGSPCVMLQLATPASGTRQYSIVEYGLSMTGVPSGATLTLRTTSTAATLGTAGVILPYASAMPYANLPSLAPVSTTTSAYQSAGATIAPAATVNAVYDAQILSTNTYIKQFPLAREPIVGVPGTQEFCQIVLNVPTTAVTVLCYIVWRE